MFSGEFQGAKSLEFERSLPEVSNFPEPFKKGLKHKCHRLDCNISVHCEYLDL